MAVDLSIEADRYIQHQRGLFVPRTVPVAYVAQTCQVAQMTCPPNAASRVPYQVRGHAERPDQNLQMVVQSLQKQVNDLQTLVRSLQHQVPVISGPPTEPVAPAPTVARTPSEEELLKLHRERRAAPEKANTAVQPGSASPVATNGDAEHSKAQARPLRQAVEQMVPQTSQKRLHGSRYVDALPDTDQQLENAIAARSTAARMSTHTERLGKNSDVADIVNYLKALRIGVAPAAPAAAPVSAPVALAVPSAPASLRPSAARELSEPRRQVKRSWIQGLSKGPSLWQILQQQIRLAAQPCGNRRFRS
eukprot:Skav217772  [mRNA]  locus=scaffold5469:47321:59710:+ [translate_table: standard]